MRMTAGSSDTWVFGATARSDSSCEFFETGALYSKWKKHVPANSGYGIESQ